MAAAAAVLVLALATPFFSVLMTVRFAGAAAAGFRAAAFLTTVDVLPSLDSLMPLALRVARVPAAVALVAAPFLALVAAAPPAAPELAVDDEAAVVRVVAVARVDRAFSTMLLNMLVAAACFAGDTGRAMSDLVGEGAGPR